MSNGALPIGSDAVSNLRVYASARLGALRLVAKYIPVFKVAEDRVTVPANQILPNGSVDRVTQRTLIRLEFLFSITDEELREPDLAAARLITDAQARSFTEAEDFLLLTGNMGPPPPRGVLRAAQDRHFMEFIRPPMVARARIPQEYVRLIFNAASRLVRRVRPKEIVFLVNSAMFDELNELIPPQLTDSPLGHVERAERLRIKVIGNTDQLPPRTAVMFGLEQEGPSGAKGAVEDRFLIDRPVGIEPELRWLGWNQGGVPQFSIAGTFALRIKDPAAYERIIF
jgi:hypothetical protein